MPIDTDLNDHSHDPAGGHPASEPAATTDVSDSIASLWSEMWPVVAFLVVYNVMRRFPEGDGLFVPDTALYWATGILMIGMGYEVIKRLMRKEKLSPLMLLSAGMVGVFGALGIILQSKAFLLHKPTIINLIFATIIFGGMLTGRNLWKTMFNSLFTLPEYAWQRLATCWGIYFLSWQQSLKTAGPIGSSAICLSASPLLCHSSLIR